MLVDLTLKITPKMAADAQGNERKALTGHLGTHFDVMDREFPLEYTEREGYIFDVRRVGTGEIALSDVDLEKVRRDAFIAFYSGFLEAEGYGSRRYFTGHPQLSDALIDALIGRGVSIIGVDFAGIRRGKEHTPKDQYCADHGVFVVENLCGLDEALAQGAAWRFSTYPMRFAECTGLPCRVVARRESPAYGSRAEGAEDAD